MSDVYETLYCEGEIERLKIEIAEANAKIARVERTLAFLDPGQFDRSLALRDGGYSWGFHKGRSGAVADVRRALESAPPRPPEAVVSIDGVPRRAEGI